MSPPNILAKVDLLLDVEYPKSKGVKTGYIPHHKFNGIKALLGGKYYFADDKFHYAGETLYAKIAFVCWEHIQSEIKVGQEFDIFELDKLVGKGVVTEILTD